MLALKVERLNMLNLSVTEEQIIIAESGLLVAGSDFQIKETSESNWFVHDVKVPAATCKLDVHRILV